VYEAAIKGPMEALIAEVDPRYQPLRLFRPNRDVRFSKDKSPYKTAAGAVGEGEDGATYYVQISAEGLMAGSGIYHMASDQLVRFREAVDDERTGPELVAVTEAMVADGCTIGAIDELKSAPRGYPKDHPRIELLRRKGIIGWRAWPVQSWLHTVKAKARVEQLWAGCAPLNAWLAANVGPSELPPEDLDRR
jgi:uncharacterized protein (TIGR02453 family)